MKEFFFDLPRVYPAAPVVTALLSTTTASDSAASIDNFIFAVVGEEQLLPDVNEGGMFYLYCCERISCRFTALRLSNGRGETDAAAGEDVFP